MEVTCTCSLPLHKHSVSTPPLDQNCPARTRLGQVSGYRSCFVVELPYALDHVLSQQCQESSTKATRRPPFHPFSYFTINPPIFLTIMPPTTRAKRKLAETDGNAHIAPEPRRASPTSSPKDVSKENEDPGVRSTINTETAKPVRTKRANADRSELLADAGIP